MEQGAHPERLEPSQYLAYGAPSDREAGRHVGHRHVVYGAVLMTAGRHYDDLVPGRNETAGQGPGAPVVVVAVERDEADPHGAQMVPGTCRTASSPG